MPPKCVGIIMDGNRRYAKQQGISTFEGHRLGYLKLKDVFLWCKEMGIGHLIVYAFSTENWNRKPEEVSYLLGLFSDVLSIELDFFKKENGRVKCVGVLDKFPKNLQELISKAERETAQNTGVTLVLALSYGGRAEIVDAVNRAVEGGRKIDEKSFADLLWTAGMPDPDLVIRTSGEQRLSGFLPWQSVYSELFFTKTYWPEFSKEEFASIVQEYGSRERRLGK